MTRQIKYVLVFCLGMIIPALATAEKFPLVEVEEAIESNALNIRLTNDLTGIIKTQHCADCDVLLLKITPATKFDIDGVSKKLIEAKTCCTGKPGTIIYDIKSKEVRAISIYLN